MDYAGLSREQLLERIQSLEMLTQELLKERAQETRLKYAWTGNLGHWYWDVKTNEVTFDPLKVTTLGYDQNEIPEQVTYQFFTDKLHPDDYPKAMEAMRKHLYGQADVYEVEYRIQAKDGTYKWYYDRGRITQFGANGEPLFLAGIVFDVTDEKAKHVELEYKNKVLSHLSSIDELTKIANRRTLIERLEVEIMDAQRGERPISIAIFDIDDFKNVNDSKGHVVGDQVLANVASIMEGCIREADCLGRCGGEEFMVVFPNTTLSMAVGVCERIRETVENEIFTDGLRITISGGVVQYRNETITELVQAADERLYAAKRSGKNRIVSEM